MVTIHPIVIYYRSGNELKHRTLVVVSSVLDHNYILVHCCFQKLFQYVKSELSHISKVYIWTDGAASQYKNKYNFTNITFMKEDFSIDVEWNFHASSHGKCACDGVGGTIKRAAHKYSLSPIRESLITDAKSFYDWAVEYQSNKMSYAFVSDLDYGEASQKLIERMENVVTIPGTHSYHCIIPIDEYCIAVKQYSQCEASEIKRLR